MTDVKIAQLLEATTVADTDLFIVEDNADTKKMTWANLKTAIIGAFSSILGNRTYTEENVVTNGESITNSINELDKAVKSILLSVYPIGAIYISISSTNPSTLFGGTWEQFASGRTIFGINSTDTDFDEPSDYGGSKTHRHISNVGVTGTRLYAQDDEILTTNDVNSYYTEVLTEITNIKHVGYTQYESTLPPYVVAYIWKRIS